MGRYPDPQRFRCTAQEGNPRTQRPMNLCELIVTQAPDGVLFVSDAGTIVLANEALCTLSGYQPHELLGQSVELFLPADLRRLHVENRQRYASEPQRRPMGTMGDLTLLRKDGTKVPIDIALSRVDGEGHVGTIAFVRDTSEAKQSERQLQHQATHDALTGLTNRWLFSEYLRHAIAHAQRAGRRVALLLLDLDGFKSVNDTFGHAIGDKLLIDVAGSLTAQVRASDVVARIGGDEFVVLLREVDELLDAVMVATKLIAALSSPRNLDGFPVQTGCSVGIAMYPMDAQEPEALMHCADLAMYHAKAQGRGRSIVFTPEMSASTTSRFAR